MRTLERMPVHLIMNFILMISKTNLFPLLSSFCPSIGWNVGRSVRFFWFQWSVCHNFRIGREVKTSMRLSEHLVCIILHWWFCMTRARTNHSWFSRWGIRFGVGTRISDQYSFFFFGWHLFSMQRVYNTIFTYWAIQDVQEKLCFFPIYCNPSLAYIAVRDLQSSQRNASVQSLLLPGIFLDSQ